MVYEFSTNNSIFCTYIAEIRDIEIQQDPMRFRRNLERISEVLAYELSKTLDYSIADINTPLGVAKAPLLKKQPVLATILRAGLSMHQGMLNYFDRADSAFVSAYRKHTSDEDFEVFVKYLAAPTIEGKVLIISDPMLATGKSMLLVYKALLKYGTPSRIIIVSAIATTEALEFLQNELPENTDYYLGAIDEELTTESYIVPGLGDAGDLAYGVKVHNE